MTPIHLACLNKKDILRKSGSSEGKEAALPLQQLLQNDRVSPFSEREADCDQKHGIVVGQKIGDVHGRVLCMVKIQKQDQQIGNPDRALGVVPDAILIPRRRPPGRAGRGGFV